MHRLGIKMGGALRIVLLGALQGRVGRASCATARTLSDLGGRAGRGGSVMRRALALTESAVVGEVGRTVR